MNSSERIIVALDTNAEQARMLASALAGSAHWLKVGMTLYYSAGPGIVAELKSMGYQVFVDLKLHDIPHQVRGAAKAVVCAGADMLTVHASGGKAMMQAAKEGADEGFAEDTASQQGRIKPICLAITVLTSLDVPALKSVGIAANDANDQVLRLAQLASEAGMHGIVCSPEETEAVRKHSGKDFVIVTPGVRPAGSSLGDQARVATPARALNAGADYLVIGRPITQAQDPLTAFNAIAKEMK